MYPQSQTESNPTKYKFNDLESQAKSMMVINNGKLNKMRKQALPKSI